MATDLTAADLARLDALAEWTKRGAPLDVAPGAGEAASGDARAPLYALLRAADDDIPRLVAAVRALARDIVGVERACDSCCPWCRHPATEDLSIDEPHSGGCPVLRARALLGDE